MKVFFNTVGLLSLIGFGSLVSAAEAPFEMPLWNGVAPGSEASSLEETISDRPITDGTDTKSDRHVKGVKDPTLTVYLPEEAAANGTVVVVIPGGGFNILAIDKEGHDVARWLNSQGVAGVVLKYRLPDVDAGVFVHNASIPDVQRAIRMVRANASEWKVNPQKVGVVGFSAGGYLTAAAGTLFDDGEPQAADPTNRHSCRPDFIAPIYPLISLELESSRGEPFISKIVGTNSTPQLQKEYSLHERVTSETPPVFLVHATDDRLSSEHSALFYLAVKRAGGRGAMHLYSQGGHGYGIRQRGLPISSWHLRWLEWLRSEGFVEQP